MRNFVAATKLLKTAVIQTLMNVCKLESFERIKFPFN